MKFYKQKYLCKVILIKITTKKEICYNRITKIYREAYMKKIILGILVCIISLGITFATFETFNWYHFGDIPTEVVLFRLVVFFIITNIILTGFILLIQNKAKKKK